MGRTKKYRVKSDWVVRESLTAMDSLRYSKTRTADGFKLYEILQDEFWKLLGLFYSFIPVTNDLF